MVKQRVEFVVEEIFDESYDEESSSSSGSSSQERECIHIENQQDNDAVRLSISRRDS